MKRYTLFAGFLALVSVFIQSSVAFASEATRPVIVVYREDAVLESFNDTSKVKARAAARPHEWGYLNRHTLAATLALENHHGFRADHVFGAALRGFSGRLNKKQIDALAKDPSIAYIEADNEMTAVGQVLPWGINILDADLSSTLAGNGSGTISNVNVYIIDTGIDTTHADLRVVKHVNFAGGVNADCNGHGTHVAGTVAARDNTTDVVGVAPGAALTGVKVLDCAGSGWTSTVIKGVDYVTANAIKPAIANLSLGGTVSTALDNAVKNSVSRGIFYSIAAGNEGANACNSSPARAGTYSGVTTTAATNNYDREPSWSNYGSCVDVWAPGVSILSTRKGGGTVTYSGTSMAAPHVGGAGALYLSRHPTATPAMVESALKSTSVTTGTRSKDGRYIKVIYVRTF